MFKRCSLLFLVFFINLVSAGSVSTHSSSRKAETDGSEYIPSESESGFEASKPKSPINGYITLDQNIPKKPRTINFATGYVEKYNRYGPRGETMKVALPKPDEIMRTKKKKKPFGYSRLEQKVARTANHYIRTGKYENYDESVLAAQKFHRNKGNLYSQNRIRKPGGEKKKPPGYNKKDNWISRRVVRHLISEGNGVSNHKRAREKAEADWEKKKKKNRESTRFYRRLRGNGGE